MDFLNKQIIHNSMYILCYKKYTNCTNLWQTGPQSVIFEPRCEKTGLLSF